jgi:hypothetical protein
VQVTLERARRGVQECNTASALSSFTILAGAIYAHDASKVFLELKEHRAHPKFAAVPKNIESAPDLRKRLGIFRRRLSSRVGDPSWGALRLKFEWYAVRLPELRERLLDLYESLFKDERQEFCRAAVRNRPAQNYTCLTDLLTDAWRCCRGL